MFMCKGPRQKFKIRISGDSWESSCQSSEHEKWIVWTYKVQKQRLGLILTLSLCTFMFLCACHMVLLSDARKYSDILAKFLLQIYHWSRCNMRPQLKMMSNINQISQNWNVAISDRDVTEYPSHPDSTLAIIWRRPCQHYLRKISGVSGELATDCITHQLSCDPSPAYPEYQEK